MAIATPGNTLTEFAVASIEAIEDADIPEYYGGTNAVEDPTEFICWVRTGKGDEYITVKVTFEQIQ